MTDEVDPFLIEEIVGMERHPHYHFARMVIAEERIYIMHSQACLDTEIDLRQCIYSLALDVGINPYDWEFYHDVPIRVEISKWNELIPGEWFTP